MRIPALPFAALGVLAGLAVAAPPVQGAQDPLEVVNRQVHGFNQFMRGWVLEPSAAAYMSVTTPSFREGVSNAVGNLGEPLSAISSLAAGEFALAANAAMRFGINTTIGLGGVRDRAVEWGYRRRPFAPGDALCRWGVPSGPFVVLPFLGPSTLRDAGASIAAHTALAQAVGPDAVIGWRASDLFVGYAPYHAEVRRMEEAALDSYAMQRSAYLQRRARDCPLDAPLLDDEEPELAER